uniref:Uncharacterized protein n=1 Tax=Chromera velia CCMP2878 TaxID=1169474 RepID=A0A0G4HHN1_9ALVE|eukprot:Cvel_6837.t1-p1 / transcript=Cvel_6837.t1 / gene=Cvel_6837 / organism=Chromera_velia_CCMP2878 / gene_product=hypothetical protein / transcript_product=hypothetical protein / location=Cvel_scaffold345:9934-10218(+) / protein_length=95 / sequence_SO=supercontig / SO=protein_coding / is_pseudo=false
MSHLAGVKLCTEEVCGEVRLAFNPQYASCFTQTSGEQPVLRISLQKHSLALNTTVRTSAAERRQLLLIVAIKLMIFGIARRHRAGSRVHLDHEGP